MNKPLLQTEKLFPEFRSCLVANSCPPVVLAQFLWEESANCILSRRNVHFVFRIPFAVSAEVDSLGVFCRANSTNLRFGQLL